MYPPFASSVVASYGSPPWRSAVIWRLPREDVTPGFGRTGHYFYSRIELAGGVLNLVKASRDQLEHALFLDD